MRTIITAAAGLEHLQLPAEQTHVVFPLLDLKHENIEAYFDLSYQTIDESNPPLTQTSNEAQSSSTAEPASRA